MKQIHISDMTLCREEGTFSFKEKIEIARQLDKLHIDAIELPKIENVRTDTLLIRTISSFVKKSVLSIETGFDIEGVENAAAALNNTAHPRLRVALPVSPVGMEYTCGKKAPKMLELITQLITAAKEKISDVEFCAQDATRAEPAFLIDAVKAAIAAGAGIITLCDDEDVMMPDEFGAFIADFIKAAEIPDDVTLSVMCRDINGMAAATSFLAVKAGASGIKTSVGSNINSLEKVAGIVKNCGDNCGFYANIKSTELKRTLSQIQWVVDSSKSGAAVTIATDDVAGDIKLTAADDISAVSSAVKALGYDLSEEDEAKVFEEFKRVSEKKTVGAKELDAIVASAALQVPPTYTLISYVINTGNIISASAQIKMKKGDQEIVAIGMGDGPIDASFHTIEQIVGCRYELDDFQIQSITEGKEAMGSAIVKLRAGGKLYSGNGISTDILGASIRAYINALNKIMYEEA